MTPWVLRLIVANIAVYFLQQTGTGIGNLLAFVPRDALLRPWTVVTYMFVHASVSHILFNMLSLYFFGPRVEERLGSRRFMILYFLSGISGAILSMIFAPYAPIVGASGAVFGIMLAFAKFWPTAEIYIMGILPLQARVAVLLMAAAALFSGIQGSRGGVADFAHLGGFVGGWLYLKLLDRRAGITKFRSKTVAPVGKETLSNYKRIDPTSIHSVNRDEVNRILDKISASGLSSLTAQEKLFLSNFVPPDDRIPPVS